MKLYPSISGTIQKGKPVYVFDKLDGSSVRAEYTKKNGFDKFGRRNGLLDDSNPILAREVEPLIRAKYEKDLTDIFKKEKLDKVIIFLEFWGPNSFAGNHADEEHTVTLFDVAIHPKGLIEPKTFMKLFGHLDHPEILHYGNFTDDLKQSVEQGTLSGMTFEGVVAKGNYVSPGMPLMFKHKNKAWLDRLRNVCGTEDEYNKRS